MRAMRVTNNASGIKRTPRAKLEAMGRDWARQHGRNAPAYGNLIHDRACAVAVKEMTGEYPPWGAERLRELGL